MCRMRALSLNRSGKTFPYRLTFLDKCRDYYRPKPNYLSPALFAVIFCFVRCIGTLVQSACYLRNVFPSAGLDGFVWNLMLVIFSPMCRENPGSVNSDTHFKNFTWRPEFGLAFLATKRHKIAVFKWNSNRLSGGPRRFKRYANMLEC